MRLRAIEAQLAHIFDNAFDPLELYRTFREPKELRSKGNYSKAANGSWAPKLAVALLADIVAQILLVGLQFIAGKVEGLATGPLQI